MNEPASSYILNNTNSPAFWINDSLWMTLAGNALTNGNFCFIEQICGVGIGGPPAHTHTQDEGLYMLEGHCTFYAGGETIKAGPGTFISVPRNTEHSFIVDVPNSRFLNFYTPAGFEMILMSIATPAAERKPPVPGSVPPPPRWMVEECSREFGMTPAPSLPFADPPSDTNMATTPSQLNQVKPYGIEAHKAPSYWQQGMLWTVIATKKQTGGSFSLLEQLCEVSSGPFPHMHEQDELLYIIEGEITAMAGKEKLTAKAGSLLYIPAHQVHSFRVEVNNTRLLNWYLPGGFEELIAEIGIPTKNKTLPPANIKMPSPSPEKLETLMKRVGMTPVAVPDFLREGKF